MTILFQTVFLFATDPEVEAGNERFVRGRPMAASMDHKVGLGLLDCCGNSWNHEFDSALFKGDVPNWSFIYIHLILCYWVMFPNCFRPVISWKCSKLPTQPWWAARTAPFHWNASSMRCRGISSRSEMRVTPAHTWLGCCL